MKELSSLVRPEVRDLKAYHVSEPHVPVKLHANESPFNLSGELTGRISSEAAKIAYNRYPDPSSADLRNVMAGQLGVPVNQLLLGNGSDELIQMIIMAFGGHAAPVIIPSPTFSMYRNIALSLGESVKAVPLDSSFELDGPAMLNECKKGPSIVFISYPNNPTGNCFSEDVIIKILDSSEGIVVIDEAYFDYSRKSFIEKLGNYPNMIILRTLSKIGLASLRLGVLIAGEELVQIVNRVRLPYNIGSMQQAAAFQALSLRDDIDSGIALVTGERVRLAAEMSSIEGLEIFRSDSNFILFRVQDADGLFEDLIGEGVLIRNLNLPGPLKDCLRVTAGTPAENDKFIDALKKITKDKKKK